MEEAAPANPRGSKRKDPKKAKRETQKKPKLFEGENHAVVWVPGSGFERASYMGPGTNVIERLKRKDKGKTPIDEVSRLHDIDYQLAKGGSMDQKEQEKKGREADERMIRNGWKAYQSHKENLWNAVQGVGGIKAKTLLEDWGLLGKTRFLGQRTFEYTSQAGRRGATEYEILLRARQELVCNSNAATGDEGDCGEATRALHSLSY
jgi:Phospholipase A2-like domain